MFEKFGESKPIISSIIFTMISPVLSTFEEEKNEGNQTGMEIIDLESDSRSPTANTYEHPKESEDQHVTRVMMYLDLNTDFYDNVWYLLLFLGLGSAVVILFILVSIVIRVYFFH